MRRGALVVATPAEAAPRVAPGRAAEATTLARFERRFYLIVTVLFLLLVLWTFAPTYFFKFLFATPPLSPLLHVHALVMAGWVALLVLQSALVTARRVGWHRRIGAFGAGWAALLVVVGSVTTLHAAVREVRGHTALAAPQIVVTTLDLAQMVLFGAFVALAIRYRRRPGIHKRLMLLTIACMLPDPLARLPGDFMTNGWILAGLYGFVMLCVAIDSVRHRRLHHALGWGSLVLLVTFTLLLYSAQSPSWIALCTRLLS